jgi:hypothetical protein
MFRGESAGVIGKAKLVVKSCWPILAVLLLMLLGGCALPPAVTLASLAADGVSYVATGKSVTDHGLSAATAQDCALLRPVFTGKAICSIDTAHARDIPVETGHASVPGPGSQPAPRRIVIAKDRYVTVGSFLSPENASRMAARYAELEPAVIVVDVHGRQFHRVVVGPLSAEEATALKARLAAKVGVQGAG